MSTHKEKGNAAFRLERWSEAIQHYTAGIELDPTSPLTANLYSNRSACYTRKAEFDLALLDANACSRLNPKFSKAQMRSAEALTRLYEFTSAEQAYAKARKIAEDETTRTRYENSRLLVDKLASEIPYDHTIKDLAVQSAPRERCEMLKNVKKIRIDGSRTAKGNYCATFDYLSKCWKLLEDHYVSKEPPMTTDIHRRRLNVTTWMVSFNIHIIDGFSNCAMSDPSAFYIAASEDSTLPVLKKLQTHLAETDRFLLFAPLYNISPEKVIDFFVEVYNEIGLWGNARISMRHFIRGCIVKANLAQLDGNSAAAVKLYKHALGCIDAGRKRFKVSADEDANPIYAILANKMGDEYGSTLHSTFQRGVQGCLRDALEVQYFARSTRLSSDKVALREICQRIIDDCLERPAPLEPTYWLPFHILPLAHAHMTLGRLAADAAKKLSTVVLQGTAAYHNVTKLKLAIKHYEVAKRLLPNDSYFVPVVLYSILAYELRLGGLSIAKIFSKAAACEQAYAESELWAGPGRRLFSERDTVRQCCTLLRNYLEEDNTVTPSKEKFQLIVKPVPSISKKVKGFNKKDHGENLGWRETLVGEVIITEIVD